MEMYARVEFAAAPLALNYPIMNEQIGFDLLDAFKLHFDLITIAQIHLSKKFLVIPHLLFLLSLHCLIFGFLATTLILESRST